MFCEKCGSPIEGNQTHCPTCGEKITPKASPVKQKTKSKWLTVLLMYLCGGAGHIYLGNWKRFWQIWLYGLATFGIAAVVLVFLDTIRVLKGTINCDVNGVPLV